MTPWARLRHSGGNLAHSSLLRPQSEQENNRTGPCNSRDTWHCLEVQFQWTKWIIYCNMYIYTMVYIIHIYTYDITYLCMCILYIYNHTYRVSYHLYPYPNSWRFITMIIPATSSGTPSSWQTADVFLFFQTRWFSGPGKTSGPRKPMVSSTKLGHQVVHILGVDHFFGHILVANTYLYLFVYCSEFIDIIPIGT